MAVLASYSAKTTFESPEITVTTKGPVQLFVNGKVNGGQVVFSLKASDGTFYEYPELSFTTPAAREFNLLAGDKLKVVFRGCVSAGAEIRQ